MTEKNYFDKLKSKSLPKVTSQISTTRETHLETFKIDGVQKPGGIEESAITTLNTYHCQTGILVDFQANEHALYIILHLTNRNDYEIRRACKTLPRLKETLRQSNLASKLEATLGIGYAKTQEWLSLVNIPFPKYFREFDEKKGPTGKRMPSTGGDLMLHIRSNRKDLCFELGRQFCQSIPDECIAQLDDTFGFSYMSSKKSGFAQDFTGFEDGHENPKHHELRAKAALIPDGEDATIHTGGSFALTQKWAHNLGKWAQLSQEDQERVIGRTKGEESKKIRPKIPTSHIGRTDLKENGVDIKVVRQSLPYGGMKEHGLFFISYASNTNKHEKQLFSMVGMNDGIHDPIMDFSTPITGNYWFIPSILVYEKLF